MLRSIDIKQAAQAEGFSVCGIARAERVSPAREAERLAWLSRGEQGDMDYLARNVDVRLDPRLLVEGAKTVVSVAVNYNPASCDNQNAEKSSFVMKPCKMEVRIGFVCHAMPTERTIMKW